MRAFSLGKFYAIARRLVRFVSGRVDHRARAASTATILCVPRAWPHGGFGNGNDAHRLSADRTGACSEILDRLPPQKLEAEKAVLGSMLLDPEMCDDVALALRPHDFYCARPPGPVRASAGDARRRRADRHHLARRAAQAARRFRGGRRSRSTWPKSPQAVPTAANAVYYANIVRDKATLRALIHASTEILRDAYDQSLEAREMLVRGRGKDLSHPRRQRDRRAGADQRCAARGLAAHRRPADA